MLTFFLFSPHFAFADLWAGAMECWRLNYVDAAERERIPQGREEANLKKPSKRRSSFQSISQSFPPQTVWEKKS